MAKLREAVSPRPSRYVIGCMSGTSLDGLDVALVKIEGRGLQMRASIVSSLAVGMGRLRPQLKSLAEQVPRSTGDIAAMQADFCTLHVRACKKLWREWQQRSHQSPKLSLISVHGQTVFHASPLSWQAFAPTQLSLELGCTVVSDLRAADIACGGQGAPLTPLADSILFRPTARPARGASSRAPRAPHTIIINLGGFCNFTALTSPSAANAKRPPVITGGDICACNLLLNAIAVAGWGKPFDTGGSHASAGTANPRLVASLMNILSEQSTSGRSLGTDDAVEPLATSLLRQHSPNDVAAAATQAISRTIAARLRDECNVGNQGATRRGKYATSDAPVVIFPETRVILAGGGSKHRHLASSIGKCLGIAISTSDQWGVPIAAREAACWAVLGALAEDGVPSGVASITGAVNAGRIRPGTWVFPM